jgi:hypothetical protein
LVRPNVQANPSTLPAGKPTVLTGGGFPSGANLLATLFSNPVLLGTTTADSLGNYRMTVNIPGDTVPGIHTIVVSTMSGPALQAQTTVTVTVAAAGATTT